MSHVPRVDHLQIYQDLHFQRREWVAQRAGWVLIVLLLIAALAGLLGRGPFSTSEASDPDGTLHIEYNRFLHYHDATTLVIHASAAAADKDELRLWLDRDYLAGVQIQRITPQPLRVEAGPDRNTFVFPLGAGATRVRITFHLEADRWGSLAGRAGLGSREPAHFAQFVYP